MTTGKMKVSFTGGHRRNRTASLQVRGRTESLRSMKVEKAAAPDEVCVKMLNALNDIWQMVKKI